MSKSKNPEALSLKEVSHAYFNIIDILGSLESVKGATDLYAPFDLKVSRVNDECIARPSTCSSGTPIFGINITTLGWLCEVSKIIEK